MTGDQKNNRRHGKDGARRIAANVAKLPKLVRKP
jgi:hypothetical protein